MPQFLNIEQKVTCLAQGVGDIRQDLRRFLAVGEVSLETAFVEARKIIEYLVAQVLKAEGIEADRELVNNIEILGGRNGAFPNRRRLTPQSVTPPPILPATLYSALHNLRISGNLVAHTNPSTLERKKVRLTLLDLQIALGQILRCIEWFFQEYPRGPHLEPLYDGLPAPSLARFGEAPPDPAPFLGRKPELENLRELLQNGPAKLVSVVASAGMGKTLLTARAALDVVARRQSERQVLMWFDLKAAPSFNEISARILASLLVDAQPTDTTINQLSPGARIGQIVRAMADCPTLLVLDNFESWLDPLTGQPCDPHVGQFLGQCASRGHLGKVVVTTRLRPALPGVSETGRATFAIGPFPLDDARSLLEREGFAASPAAVEHVWNRFDGNPRILMMLTEILRTRHCRDLDAGLKLHPALIAHAAEGLLAEVWSELSPLARQALETMAVLRPPMPVADIVGVLAECGRAEVGAIEDVLWTELSSRALVVPSDDGAAFRFEHLLIRDQALKSWADVAVPQRAALRHYRRIAKSAGDELTPAHQEAIYFALLLGEFNAAAQEVGSPTVRRAFMRQGRTHEFIELCQRVLARQDLVEQQHVIRLQRLMGWSLNTLGEYRAARDLLQQTEANLAALRGTEEEFAVLNELGTALHSVHAYAEAEAVLMRSLAVARTLTSPGPQGWALLELAALELQRGQREVAAAWAQAALDVAERNPEDLMQRAMARSELARNLSPRTELPRIQKLFEEAHALSQQAKHVPRQAFMLRLLANVKRLQLDFAAAVGLVNQALDIYQRIGNRFEEGITRNLRARIFMEMDPKSIDEPSVELKRSLQLEFESKHVRGIGRALRSYVELSCRRGLPQQAAACLRAFVAIWPTIEKCDELGYLGHRVQQVSGVDALQVAIQEEDFPLLEQATEATAVTWKSWLKPAAVSSSS